MRELLQQALAEVKAARELVYEKTGLVEFNKPLGLESAIEAALSRSKWVKVSDGLPVVPEGKYSDEFWIFNKVHGVRAIRIFKHETAAELTALLPNCTHWQYRQDDTPAPPEDL